MNSYIGSIPGALPEPSRCDNCCSENIAHVLRPIEDSKFSPIWYCNDCEAMVGCHGDSRTPLGRMADTETRRLRAQCHGAFDPLWQSGLLSRNLAYKWLASQLKIQSNHCHISWLTKSQLELAIQVSLTFFEERKQFAERRQEKRTEKKEKLIKRTRRHIDNRKKRY